MHVAYIINNNQIYCKRHVRQVMGQSENGAWPGLHQKSRKPALVCANQPQFRVAPCTIKVAMGTSWQNSDGAGVGRGTVGRGVVGVRVGVKTGAPDGAALGRTVGAGKGTGVGRGATGAGVVGQGLQAGPHRS